LEFALYELIVWLWLYVALAQEIVVVHVGNERVEVVDPVLALGREEPRIEIPVAEVAIGLHVVVEAVVNQAEPVGHFKLGWLPVDFMVCDRIPN
jgi:hypothetical protein